MKKLFAVLFSIGMVSTVFAQSNRHIDYPSNSRDVVLGQNNRNIYNDNRYDNYSFSDRERETRIAQVNREFDFRIQAVQRDRYLRNAEKKRQVRSLEIERAEQIRLVR